MNIQDKNSIQIIFGNNLCKIRKGKGFTQEQLANELGVEISQISKIERGIINTSIATLHFISIILVVDLNEFF